MARVGTPLRFEIRQHIRELRLVQGMKVRAVAAQAGVNKETVSKYAPTRKRAGDAP